MPLNQHKTCNPFLFRCNHVAILIQTTKIVCKCNLWNTNKKSLLAQLPPHLLLAACRLTSLLSSLVITCALLPPPPHHTISSALELSILSHPFVHHWQLNTPSLLQTHPTLCASPFYTLAGKPVTLQFEINEPFVNIILLAQDGKKLQWKAGEREREFSKEEVYCAQYASVKIT